MHESVPPFLEELRLKGTNRHPQAVESTNFQDSNSNRKKLDSAERDRHFRVMVVNQ